MNVIQSNDISLKEQLKVRNKIPSDNSQTRILNLS